MSRGRKDEGKQFSIYPIEPDRPERYRQLTSVPPRTFNLDLAWPDCDVELEVMSLQIPFGREALLLERLRLIRQGSKEAVFSGATQGL